MKISFCTTCMDRLKHLKETYPNNLEIDPHIEREFVLLDYSSRVDDVGGWVRDNLMSHIESGLLSYYRLNGQKYFVATHAKNVAYSLATGDLICNLDADCFLEKGFCEHVLNIFVKNGERQSIIAGTPIRDRNGHEGANGKVVCWKETFQAVNGYDEDIYMGWGNDAENFAYRVKKFNDLSYHEFEPKWNRVIEHSHATRTKNCQLQDARTTNLLAARLTIVAERTNNYVANYWRNWGVATVKKNFTEEIIVENKSSVSVAQLDRHNSANNPSLVLQPHFDTPIPPLAKLG